MSELHNLRGRQLCALGGMHIRKVSHADGNRIVELIEQCDGSYLVPEKFSTRKLSDKALEEIEALASKYLEYGR